MVSPSSSRTIRFQRLGPAPSSATSTTSPVLSLSPSSKWLLHNLRDPPRHHHSPIIFYPPGRVQNTVKVVLYLRVNQSSSFLDPSGNARRLALLPDSGLGIRFSYSRNPPSYKPSYPTPSPPALARDGNDFSRQHLLVSSLRTAGYNLNGSTDDAAHLAIASIQLPGQDVGARPINTITITITIALTFSFTRASRTPTLQLVRGSAFQTALRDRSDRANAGFPPTDTFAGTPPRARVRQPRCEACVSWPSNATCRGRRGGVQVGRDA